MRLFAFIFIVFAFAIQNGVAQDLSVEKSDSIAKIEGDVYIIHVVKPKQTLFSIAKAYEVKLSRIAFDNPGVLDGLKLDLPLRILKSAVGETKPPEITEETLELDGHYVLYTVPKQKTLYAISREYNTTISAILDANPELSDGLKVGSTIRIPTPKIFGNEKINGEKKDTKMEMVGLPDIVRNRITPFVYDSVKPASSTIALVLPLYLDLNDTLRTKKLEKEPEGIYDKSEIALQFYEGVLLAMDTLKALGYKVNLKVIDDENQPWKLRNLVAKGEFKNTDLIIGPFFSKTITEISGYAYQHCIPLVSPTIKGVNIISDNPYVFKMIPSDEAMIVAMGSYLAKSDSTNNMILHYGTADEQKLLWRFRKGLESSSQKQISFPAYDISKSGTDSIRNKLSLTRRNNIIVLSNNEVKLAGLIRRISNWTKDASIVSFAPNTWTTFRNIEVHHFDQLRMHMPTAFHVDYERLEVQEFVQKFRAKFNTEPSSFAFRGYDLFMHFVRNLDGIKANGVEYMELVEETGLQSSFRWKKLEDGGFENTRALIVDYSGLKLKLATD